MKCEAVGCVNGKVALFSSVVDCDACGGSGWGKGKSYEFHRNEVFANIYGKAAASDVVPHIPVPHVGQPSTGLPNRIKIDLINDGLYDKIDNKDVIDLLGTMQFWRYINVTGMVNQPGHFRISGYAWNLDGMFDKGPPNHKVVIDGFGTYYDGCAIRKIIEKHLRTYW